MKAVILLSLLSASCYAVTIAQWNFSNLSLSPSFGTGTLSLIGTVNGAFVSGDPLTANALNTSPYPAQSTGNKTSGIRCQVSTAGYSRIRVTWYRRVSPTASTYARFQFSTNGTAFVDAPFAFSMFSPDEFESEGVEFDPFDGADNNSKFAFRIVTEFESTAIGVTNHAYYTTASLNYTTVGTERFDLITVSGERWAASLAAVKRLTNGIQFRVTGATGSNYVIQATDAIGPSAWMPVQTNASPFNFTDTNLTAERFYRAFLLP